MLKTTILYFSLILFSKFLAPVFAGAPCTTKKQGRAVANTDARNLILDQADYPNDPLAQANLAYYLARSLKYGDPIGEVKITLKQELGKKIPFEGTEFDIRKAQPNPQSFTAYLKNSSSDKNKSKELRELNVYLLFA